MSENVNKKPAKSIAKIYDFSFFFLTEVLQRQSWISEELYLTKMKTTFLTWISIEVYKNWHLGSNHRGFFRIITVSSMNNEGGNIILGFEKKPRITSKKIFLWNKIRTGLNYKISIFPTELFREERILLFGKHNTIYFWNFRNTEQE